ncbi:type III restriction enzyme, res subunit [Elizabethkingia anophelis R26]|uniref:Type III restriction endonuclease subunit R n=1 Tax=Elizabethkingia anophelis R26 TaxID=1246994 RepID=A0ABN5BU51_9FLAO|nr:type III restriction endonuclease subunit R [Elizabethkingia anophelis R26]ATC41308.1 type III restriction endonuclease subunit R [Elizabethkingia anophelis Ag1]ATC44985.1 type III restriction endonuclease subunit R [Elizabethkingia anophelis]ATC48661.1 type III restriction endonuclease subunit R [Elizabethkingia anophelis]ELR81144.1 type III restriction enzyme, res subunit [Elizabethkingia anophelis R26]
MEETHSGTFNAMFCVSSIDVLQKYYALFQQEKRNQGYSYWGC